MQEQLSITSLGNNPSTPSVPIFLTFAVCSCGVNVYVMCCCRYSHYNGPAYRPFCGWYMSSFSHARRVIDPNPSLPTNDGNIAFWDAAAGQCKSWWALQK